MKVFFDTKNIYYLPQYNPVIQALSKKGHECYLIVYSSKNEQAFVEKNVQSISAVTVWVENEEAARDYYVQNKPNWIFFANQFAYLEQIHKHSKTAQLGHGIGPKPSYYTKSNTAMTVRFIEGGERLQKIQNMYPADTFVQVGFSKLDPIFKQQELGLSLSQMGLNPQLKTILYAPTFNPSSIERFPDNWPEHFCDYNIIIKAHAFTYSKKSYSGQRQKLQAWKAFDNTYVAQGDELSLLPFMVHADILLSEASSTLFEFAALNKPVVVCDFFKLKWFYRGIFKYRFERRFRKDNVLFNDIGSHVDSYKQLKQTVQQQLSKPNDYHKMRLMMTEKHVGPTDGKASERIVDYLESHK